MFAVVDATAYGATLTTSLNTDTYSNYNEYFNNSVLNDIHDDEPTEKNPQWKTSWWTLEILAAIKNWWRPNTEQKSERLLDMKWTETRLQIYARVAP